MAKIKITASPKAQRAVVAQHNWLCNLKLETLSACPYVMAYMTVATRKHDRKKLATSIILSY